MLNSNDIDFRALTASPLRVLKTDAHYVCEQMNASVYLWSTAEPDLDDLAVVEKNGELFVCFLYSDGDAQTLRPPRPGWGTKWTPDRVLGRVEQLRRS